MPHDEEVDDAVARARKLGAVRIGGDAVSSMGGRGVDGRDLHHALENAVAAIEQGADLLVTGPTIDGEALTIVVRITDDCFYVRNVLL